MRGGIERLLLKIKNSFSIFISKHYVLSLILDFSLKKKL
jgi:hypothetical protein